MRYQFLRFPDGKDKAVTLSYDDGCPSDVRFSKVISESGLKCTFNINSIDEGICSFSEEEIREHFLSKGHEIAVHGFLHKAEGLIRPIEGICEVLECRKELEKKFGFIIRGMAYPDSGIRKFSSGASYENIKKYLADLGIAYARTLGGDNTNFELPSDWHAWMPSAHHTNPEILEMIDKFNSIDLKTAYCSTRTPKLFYMWGHSFEFDGDNNWDFLDEICKRLSGKDNVWYATNMEIYKYVNAYNSLIYSADGKIIYNPTLFDIWFDMDYELYHIKPGETIKI